jgi:hypothetical protein
VAEADLLGRLDGTLPLASTERVAAEAGVPVERWRDLLRLTHHLGILVDRDDDAPALEGTARTRVVVDGSGALASELAAALSCSHVTVLHGRAAVDRVLAAPARPRPDLVVLIGSPVVDPRRGDVWLRHGIPHLPVAPAGPRTVVGPLVDASPATPCLWCLDRHRADRDEAWPTVMTQATPPREPALAGPPEGLHDPLRPGLMQIVVGTVTLLVARLLEGHAPPPGVSVEVSLPWPRMDHRRWPRHPLCPAHPATDGPGARGAARASTTAGPADHAPGPAQHAPGPAEHAAGRLRPGA